VHNISKHQKRQPKDKFASIMLEIWIIENIGILGFDLNHVGHVV
jgi:hypothetical protein